MDVNLGVKSHEKSPVEEMLRESKGMVQFQKPKFSMPVCSCLRGNEGSTLIMSSQGSMKLLKQNHLVPPERATGGWLV